MGIPSPESRILQVLQDFPVVYKVRGGSDPVPVLEQLQDMYLQNQLFDERQDALDVHRVEGVPLIVLNVELYHVNGFLEWKIMGVLPQ